MEYYINNMNKNNKNYGAIKGATVTCIDCKERFATDKVEFLDISEDFQGHDLMTFVCPKCETEQESYIKR